MSYCRWSSENFGSDVYCYANVSGVWTTHVAGNRSVGTVPPIPDLMRCTAEEYAAACRAQSAFLEGAEREYITLPHAGETFNDESPEAMRDRLLQLRALGYRVPEHALSRLAEEIAEDALAQGTEAREGEDPSAGLHAKHDGPVANGDAP